MIVDGVGTEHQQDQPPSAAAVRLASFKPRTPEKQKAHEVTRDVTAWASCDACFAASRRLMRARDDCGETNLALSRTDCCGNLLPGLAIASVPSA